MEYRKACVDDTLIVNEIVQNTIKSVYPKYYPTEVVEFFSQLHNYENILKDISNGNIGLLVEGEVAVGTGSFVDNHITRVYVRPEFQGRGYGTCVMNFLEEEIFRKYDKVYLDASLPASHMYEMRGYNTVTHSKWEVSNGVILVYEIMEKYKKRIIN